MHIVQRSVYLLMHHTGCGWVGGRGSVRPQGERCGVLSRQACRWLLDSIASHMWGGKEVGSLHIICELTHRGLRTAQEMFDSADKDGSGILDEKEFRQLIAKANKVTYRKSLQYGKGGVVGRQLIAMPSREREAIHPCTRVAWAYG